MQPLTNLAFFGTTNELSLATFETLLDNGVVPKAVIVTAEAAGSTGDSTLEQLRPSAPVSELPLLSRYYEPTLIQAAWSAGVPVLASQHAGEEALGELLEDFRLEVVCAVCYPRKLPLTLITLPPFGFLNVHPSLLPHYRGPAPLFWLYQKNDLAHRGVSIHQMDAGFDTGPLVTQEPISFANGLGQAMIERHCGEVGGRLLIDAIEALSLGQRARPQKGPGSYHPWPSAADYRLYADWPAMRAFNFMRATDGTHATYPLRLSDLDTELILAEALQVDPEANQEVSALFSGPVVHLCFSPGVLSARLAPR